MNKELLLSQLKNKANITEEEYRKDTKKANSKILQYIIDEYSDGNKSLFAKMIGVPPQAINNYLRIGFGESVLSRILFAIEEPEEPIYIPQQKPHALSTDEIASAIADLKKQLDEYIQREIELREQIKKKDEQIDKLLDIMSKG